METYNERRIIHVVKRGIFNYPGLSFELLGELAGPNFNHSYGYRSSPISITYYCHTLSDAEAFSDLLDKNNIPFSTHPVRDFNYDARRPVVKCDLGIRKGMVGK
jgi:hypothetical protein